MRDQCASTEGSMEEDTGLSIPVPELIEEEEEEEGEKEHPRYVSGDGIGYTMPSKRRTARVEAFQEV